MTSRYDPNANPAENYAKIVTQGIMTLMCQAGLPSRFWVRAALYFCVIYERIPNRGMHGSKYNTPYEIMRQREYNWEDLVRGIHPFGCRVYVHIPRGLRPHTHGCKKSLAGILLGVSSTKMGYIVWIPETNTILGGERDLFFVTDRFPLAEAKRAQEEAKYNLREQKEALTAWEECEDRSMSVIDTHEHTTDEYKHDDTLDENNNLLYTDILSGNSAANPIILSDIPELEAAEAKEPSVKQEVQNDDNVYVSKDLLQHLQHIQVSEESSIRSVSPPTSSDEHQQVGGSGDSTTDTEPLAAAQPAANIERMVSDSYGKHSGRKIARTRRKADHGPYLSHHTLAQIESASCSTIHEQDGQELTMTASNDQGVEVSAQTESEQKSNDEPSGGSNSPATTTEEQEEEEYRAFNERFWSNYWRRRVAILGGRIEGFFEEEAYRRRRQSTGIIEAHLEASRRRQQTAQIAW